MFQTLHLFKRHRVQLLYFVLAILNASNLFPSRLRLLSTGLQLDISNPGTLRALKTMLARKPAFHGGSTKHCQWPR